MFAEDPNARLLASAITEPVVTLDARGDPAARLAAEIPTLDNGGLRVVTDDPTAPAGRLVATFRLRDARWQDGAPVTAADVRYAHDVDALAPQGSVARWIADRVDAIDVLDDHTFRVTYRANERWERYALAPRVLPRHLLATASAAVRASYAREPMHAGPFSVAAWIPGYGVTLAAFKDHVGGAPALGRIEVRFFADHNAVLDALRRGEIDLAPSPGIEADLTRTLDRLADPSHLDVIYTASEALTVLRFAPQGRFAEPAVRHAVELAIDRQALVDDIFAGRSRVPRSYLVPPLWAATESARAARSDRATSRALLAQAGYRAGAFGVLERSPTDRMVVTILTASGSPARLDAARRIAGDLAAVGIAADVRTQPAPDVDASVARGEYELALVGVRADDAMSATARWRGQAGPWFDVLATTAERTGALDEKRGLYAELQRLWAEELPALPIYQELRVDVATGTLTGLQPPPDGGAITWNVAAWRYRAP